MSVEIPMQDRKGKERKIVYDGYLYGLLQAMKIKKENKLHSLVLVIGGVGSGKSTLVKGMAALDCHINELKQKLSIDDFHWSMDNVINAMDNTENLDRPIIADEWIQSGGSRGFALTSIGNKLKIGFVTKRLKRNTYYLLVDKIQEFPEKLIEMCDCLIRVRRFGLKRGYMEIYTDIKNIYYIWNGIKNMNKQWDSKDIRIIKPDHKGTFPDYEDIFIDEEEFVKRKLEQTKQNEDSTDKKEITNINAIKKFKELGYKNTQIADFLGIHKVTVGEKLKKVIKS
jgi:energy-coupling factor transporter ATP-binding protein EcfA2